ncbi:MAG: DsrE family protein [Victivallales bacterium]|nr:DsrE family protein [Victivallales bacterium]
MKTPRIALLSVALTALLVPQILRAQEPKPAPTRLVVLWTSGDPEVAHKVCLMYTHAAGKNKWFDEVRLVVWGPSARLLAADKDLQAKIKTMMADGIKLEACVACASSYGVSDTLRELGIEVKGMGKPLSNYIQQGWKVLTF